MTIDLLERAATALGPMLGEVVFVGGATVTLWITDPGAPAPRPTQDVDVVVEVLSRPALHAFESRLRARGFAEDANSPVICRWRYHDKVDDDLILDAMPADASLLGFANRWQGAAVPHAVEQRLPSRGDPGDPAAHLMATKLETFRGRGRGDHLASHDLEDVVILIDGREELVDDILAAPAELRRHLASECGALLADARFVDAIFGFLRPDRASQARAQTIVVPRLLAIAAGPEPQTSAPL